MSATDGSAHADESNSPGGRGQTKPPRCGGFLTMLRAALVLLTFCTVLTGIVYPLAITGIARVLFPWQAAGSLINRKGQPTLHRRSAIGSAQIGQYFNQPWYFWPRPSATSPVPYNAAASGGSNLGPTNPTLIAHIKQRVQALRNADIGNSAPIPVDLLTSSASGLDPDESVAAAYYQIPRIARLRRMSPRRLKKLIARYTSGPQFGLLGEKVVNVLELNLALDRAAPYPPAPGASFNHLRRATVR